MKTLEPEEKVGIHNAKACPDSPLRRAITLLGDTWTLLIVINLLDGTTRFNMLRAALGRISSKTLSQRLKSLEELGFVQREAFLEIPPRVEYCLTERGLELGKVIEAIEQFGERNLSASTFTEQCQKVSHEDIACFTSDDSDD
jgi:DNA-binding HxlR family transcriptional regulator